jgi:hypothetical protein
LPPRITEIVPTSEHKPVVWRYTFREPAGDWVRPGFNDSEWKQGPGGFGTTGTPDAIIGTTWHTPDIWLRREVTLPAETDPGRIQLRVYHDEDADAYINGVLAARQSGYVAAYELVEIQEAARSLLKPGAKVVLAVHCHQTGGGQGIDIGLVDVVEAAQ